MRSKDARRNRKMRIVHLRAAATAIATDHAHSAKRAPSAQHSLHRAPLHCVALPTLTLLVDSDRTGLIVASLCSWERRPQRRFVEPYTALRCARWLPVRMAVSDVDAYARHMFTSPAAALVDVSPRDRGATSRCTLRSPVRRRCRSRRCRRCVARARRCQFHAGIACKTQSLQAKHNKDADTRSGTTTNAAGRVGDDAVDAENGAFRASELSCTRVALTSSHKCTCIVCMPTHTGTGSPAANKIIMQGEQEQKETNIQNRRLQQPPPPVPAFVR